MQDAHRGGRGFRGGKTCGGVFSHLMRKTGRFGTLVGAARPGGARRQRGAPAGRRRAHFASPRRPGGARRHIAGSLRKPAKSGSAHFACALTFAGMYSLNPSFFSPARLADKRPSRPASCQSPPPKAVPALGIYPASGSTSFFILKLRSMGHNAVSFQDYRGQFRVRKSKAKTIRSTPRIQLSSSDFHQQWCSG